MKQRKSGDPHLSARSLVVACKPPLQSGLLVSHAESSRSIMARVDGDGNGFGCVRHMSVMSYMGRSA